MCLCFTYYHLFVKGIALLGSMTDMNEARSLSYKRNIADIYSNSWGPFHSGDNVEGPGHLTSLAFERGAAEVMRYFPVKIVVQQLFMYRAEMGRVLYFCGLMVMVAMMMTVLLMAMHPVYTPLLLELLELMGGVVFSMRCALQKWL